MEAAVTSPAKATDSSPGPPTASATEAAAAPDRYSRVGPPGCGGPPIRSPSTKVAPAPSTIDAMRCAVAGATALASSYVPANPTSATDCATSTAASGGQMH